MNDATSIRAGTPFNASSVTLLPGYDKYLAHGPNSAGSEQFEMSPIDSPREPLLSPRAQYFRQQQVQSPPTLHQEQMSSREAPLHRPQLSEGQRSYMGSPLSERNVSPFMGPYQQVERQYSYSDFSPQGSQNYGQYPPIGTSPQSSPQQYMHSPQPGHYRQYGSQSEEEVNMAGRGTFRR